MLNRQKAILHLLREGRRAVSRLELTKWAFLLRHETASQGGPAFYQFVPYHYGPFSFCLYHEMGVLVRRGFVKEPKGHVWRLPQGRASEPTALPASLLSDIGAVVSRTGRWSARELLDYVYGRFPWFTVNSKVRRLVARPVAEPAVYTAGYEGLAVDQFLNGLIRAGIRQVIDVRSNPVARRYGFHGTTLARLCRSVGIGYAQFPSLGVPPGERRHVNDPQQYSELFDRYRAQVLPRERDTVGDVARLMDERPSVLVCFEADPSHCHRSCLASALVERTGLPLAHLDLAR